MVATQASATFLPVAGLARRRAQQTIGPPKHRGQIRRPDQSDGRVVVRINGPLLTQGVHIDLHPNVFGPGSAALMAVAHIGIHLWQINSASTYELSMFRSFAVLGVFRRFWRRVWHCGSARSDVKLSPLNEGRTARKKASLFDKLSQIISMI